MYYASLQAGRRLFRRDYPMRDFIVKKKSLIHFCLRDSQGEALIQSAIASMESILPFLLLTSPSLSLSTFSHSPLHLQYSFLFSSPFTKFAAFFCCCCLFPQITLFHSLVLLFVISQLYFSHFSFLFFICLSFPVPLSLSLNIPHFALF